MEARQEFGVRVEAEAVRLGMPLSAGLSEGLNALGDGAGWTWDLAADDPHGRACPLDFWHAAGHLAAAGRAGLGETQAMRAWLDGAKRAVAADGYEGALQALRGAAGEDGVVGPGAVEQWNSFAGQEGRMNHALRLRRGQAVGGGAAEGAVEQLVNLRMKRAGAPVDAGAGRAARDGRRPGVGRALRRPRRVNDKILRHTRIELDVTQLARLRLRRGSRGW